jgi:spermine oxidase
MRFKKPVKNINYEGKGAPIIVTCTDESVFTADHVIVTVSLGVLKHEHKTMFTPSLHTIKQDSIESIAFGTLNKLVLEFEKPFWPYGWPGFAMIWTQEDLQEISTKNNSWVTDIVGFWPISYQPNLLYAFCTGSTARKLETMATEEILRGVLYLFDRFLSKHIVFTKPYVFAYISVPQSAKKGNFDSFKKENFDSLEREI